MKIFLNSSRLLKDFRKIKYAMPCNASYTRFYFWKVFICTIIWYAFLYALLFAQNLILVKSGCYNISFI
jgi:hypothetical protein